MTKIFDLLHIKNEIYMVEHGENITIPYNGYFILGGNKLNQFRGEGVRYTTHLSRKIIATTNKSLGLPLLPAIEEDIQPNIPDILDSDQIFPYEMGYRAGYKAKQAKKYTEEDMKEAFRRGMRYVGNSLEGTVQLESGKEFNERFNKLLQSLNPVPKQVEVSIQNCETEDEGCIGTYSGVWKNGTEFTMGYRLDLLNNIVKVKRWIYE